MRSVREGSCRFMDTELIKTVGQVAGIGGIALGVFLLLFCDLIRKQIFPMLAQREASRLLGSCRLPRKIWGRERRRSAEREDCRAT
jgi:hypothetical protein